MYLLKHILESELFGYEKGGVLVPQKKDVEGPERYAMVLYSRDEIGNIPQHLDQNGFVPSRLVNSRQ